MMYEPNKIIATLKVVVIGEFYDDEACEETVRYLVEQDLEDVGFDVDVKLLKEQEPMTPEEFKDGLLKMFSSIWECEIDHPVFQDTIGELMNGVMQLYKKAVKRE